MHPNEIIFSTATPIDGYGPGFFRVGGKVIEGSVCLTLEAALDWHGMDDLDLIGRLRAKVDVVLVGTGADMLPIPSATRRAFEDAGLGIDPMATPSACRTYNILLSEGRRVAAALLPI